MMKMKTRRLTWIIIQVKILILMLGIRMVMKNHLVDAGIVSYNDFHIFTYIKSMILNGIIFRLFIYFFYFKTRNLPRKQYKQYYVANKQA